MPQILESDVISALRVPPTETKLTVYRWRQFPRGPLYMYVNAIRTGETRDIDWKTPPGHLNLARWLTTACCICRLYMQTKEPTETLNILVYIIAYFYFPMFVSRLFADFPRFVLEISPKSGRRIECSATGV